MRRLGLPASLILLAACEPERPPVIMYPVVPREQRVEARPEPASLAPGEWPYEMRSREADIVVTTARKLDRPTEVVGVIDTHEPSGKQDVAFALLRQRAAAMGADAVVGVEFHHGDEKDEPTHLSGLAVRYTR